MMAGAGMDKGKGKGKERAHEPPQPLRAQTSQGSTRTVIAGKTPTAQAGWYPDYFSIRTPTGEVPAVVSSPVVRATPMLLPLPSPVGERPGMYKHASRSMVDILQTASLAVDNNNAEDDEATTGKGTGKGKAKEASEARGEAPAYDGPGAGGVGRTSTLKRRRSMPEIMAAPPPYTLPLFPSPFFNPAPAHPLAQARIAPRDDEGREALPAYSNAILLRGVMPRKMEFSAPGVQAKDRKWRRVLCELEGTVFRVYRCAGEGWWERRVGAGDVAASGAAVASAAAQAAAAVKARATASATAQEGKIAGEEARIGAGAGAGGEAGGAGDGGGDGTTEVMIPPRSSTSSARSRASSTATTPPSPSPTETTNPASRSRLNLGLSLLKPRSHGRSKSEMPNAPKTPTTPRSSLSIPRPSFGGSSSSSPGSVASSSTTLAGSTSGASLAPSRSNVSLASSRSGVLSARTPAMPASASSSKGKGKAMGAAAAGTDLSEPDPADLIRAYTLQHAESGLGNDYLKRKHVIRVRLEGEQFLLQARDVADVVDWIEVRVFFCSGPDLEEEERLMGVLLL
ncbi:hypothetical protein B0H19DRAFT_128418 [Mycena capillaripes]|nr:hypothetical protein B0H19DRAFT_128418 [Mycena capillaripes]